ncbi:MAG: hypothetical protein PIR02_08820 [Microbacterium enclense]
MTTHETVIWETLTGQHLETVEASEGNWERGRVTDLNHVFQIDALGLNPADRADLFGEDCPRDRVLTELVDGTPIYHGLIVDWDYDDNAGTYTVTHVDLRELLTGRYLFGVGGYHSDGVFDWTGLSWRGMASRALYYLLRYQDSPRWAVPINLPPEEAGDEVFRTWCYEMKLGESILADIEGRPGGPDVDFQPGFFGSGYGWEALIGSPFLTGPDVEVVLGADASPVKNLKIARRGRAVSTGVFGIGDGSEQRLQVAQVPAAADGRIVRDSKVTFKKDTGVTVDSQLHKRAEGYLAARQKPTQRWSFDLDADAVDLTTLRLGSIIYVQSEGHRFAPDGESAHRVLGFAGSLAEPETVKLTLETLQDAEDGDSDG